MATVTELAMARYSEELSAVADALAANLAKLLRHSGKVYGNIVDGGQLWSSEYTVTVNLGMSEREDPAKLEKVDSYLARNLLTNLAAEYPEFRTIQDWRKLTRETINQDLVDRLLLVAHRRVFKGGCDVQESLTAFSQLSQPNESKKVNTADLIKLFLDYKRAGGGSPEYVDGQKRRLNVFTRYYPQLPDQPTQIEAYLSRFSNETPTGQDTWMTLKMLFDFASSRHGVPNPMTQVRKPHFRKKAGQRMSREQSKQFLTAVQTPLEWALVTCYFGLRLRRSEAGRLTFADIKSDFIVVQGKERTEELPLHPVFRDKLLALRNGSPPGAPVFRGRNGALTGSTLAYHIEQIFSRAKLEGVRGSPHTLRNTAAVLYSSFGGDWASNRQLLRHSAQTMTDHYCHLTPDELREKDARHNPMLSLMRELGLVPDFPNSSSARRC